MDTNASQVDPAYREHTDKLCALIITRLHAEGHVNKEGVLYGYQPARRKDCDLLALNIGLAYEQALIDAGLRETFSPFVGFGLATRGYSWVMETIHKRKEQQA